MERPDRKWYHKPSCFRLVLWIWFWGKKAYEYDNQECVKARQEAANQSPAQCYNFSGTSEEYYSGSFSRSAFSSVGCDDNFEKDKNYVNGMVYVKDSEGKISAKPITEYEALVAASNNDNGTAAATTIKTGDMGNPDVACGETGGGNEVVYPSFDIGCRHQGNPIIDMLFAFIRILTTGIGFALVGSIIIAGFQYATASGDPNKTAVAKRRLVSTLIVALPLYLLTYAILNWLVPGAIF